MENYSKIFAENLRRFRKHMNITQQQLGERLGYSEKAVSKWEGGSSIPPAETLILLADTLNVSLDELFSHSSLPEYYLGIDGGATKTTFALADRDGNILQKIVLGPSNPFDLGISGATAVLEDGIAQITASIHKRKISLFAGISGGGTYETRERIKAFLSGHGFLRANNASDSANIIAAGLNGDDGAVIIMGTGSSCFVSRGGEQFRIGGLGYLFDHGGSGYDLGNAAIRAACCAEDGSGEPTLIHKYMLEACKTQTVIENNFDFYSMGKSGIASYAPIIFKAYNEGDKLAEAILKKNMRRVANLIITAGKRLGERDEKIKIVCVGGLTKQYDILSPMINEALEARGVADKFDISIYDGDIVIGALINAGMPYSAKK